MSLLLADVRGWGEVAEPLSLSQAAEWAGRYADTWADIFRSALSEAVVFSPTPDTLGISHKTPAFDMLMDVQPRRDYLWVTGISKWHIDASPAGILESVATVSSECLLAIQPPAVSVSFTNEFPSLHVIPPTKPPDLCNDELPIILSSIDKTGQSTHYPSPPLSSAFPSAPKPTIPLLCSSPSISPSSAEHNPCNYLAVLTLAWTYVLSSYWAEIQGGVTEYIANTTPITARVEQAVPGTVNFHLPMTTGADERIWWRAILSPNGWKSLITREGREWISPWSLSLNSSKFVVMGDLSLIDETYGQPLSFSQSLGALRNFAKSNGLLGQARMALMAALSVPTHNLHKIIVNLPRPNHRMPTMMDEESQIPCHFDGLVKLIPQLVTIRSFTFASFIRSAFYDDSIHSMECGQWIHPAIFSRPEFSPLAVAVGSVRCPKLINWWGGMGISGLLSKTSVGRLAGSCMWRTDLAFFAWTHSKHSFFCRAQEDVIQLTIKGRGHNRVISRADETLMLFITSGQGPNRRLSSLSSSPWRPPGEVWFEKSGTRIIRAGNEGLKAQLVYLSWEWGATVESNAISSSTTQAGPDIDRMAEDSGCATRAILGWLADSRGPEADMNVELLALRHQQQLVEDDSQVGGSDHLSESQSILDTPTPNIITPSRTMPIHLTNYTDADLMDQLDVENDYVVEKFEGIDSGWCGLIAVNHGLIEAGLAAIGKDEALSILARTEVEIEQSGMSVRDLENLLNTRHRSAGIVDVGSGKNWKLRGARQEVILLAADFRTHFMGISKRQEMQL